MPELPPDREMGRPHCQLAVFGFLSDRRLIALFTSAFNGTANSRRLIWITTPAEGAT